MGTLNVGGQLMKTLTDATETGFIIKMHAVNSQVRDAKCEMFRK
jgi:hypothetical protein